MLHTFKVEADRWLTCSPDGFTNTQFNIFRFSYFNQKKFCLFTWYYFFVKLIWFTIHKIWKFGIRNSWNHLVIKGYRIGVIKPLWKSPWGIWKWFVHIKRISISLWNSSDSFMKSVTTNLWFFFQGKWMLLFTLTVLRNKK